MIEYLEENAPGFSIEGLAARWRDYAEMLGTPRSELMLAAPNFFIAGLPKSGTTWLADHLRTDPQFAVPAEKESRYFSQVWRVADINFYLQSNLGRIGRLIGDASLCNSLLPSVAAARVAGLFPGLKVVILLRDPIERLWSHLRHQWFYGEGAFWLKGPKSAPVGLENWIAAAHHPLIRTYAEYREIVENLERHFGRERVLVATLEQIEADPTGTLATIGRFLGAEHPITSSEDPAAKINFGHQIPMPIELKAALLAEADSPIRRSYDFLHERFGLPCPEFSVPDRRSAADADWIMGDAVSAQVFSGLQRQPFEHRAQAALNFQALTAPPTLIPSDFQGWMVEIYRGWLYAITSTDLNEATLAVPGDYRLRRPKVGWVRARTIEELADLVQAAQPA